MSSSYKTISSVSEAIFREKMSKFIAIAMPVRDENEARAAVDRIRNEYHDARHVCWAYMLGADRSRFMLNDNGEPSGTAGKPILGQINSFGLTNIAVAVVRYFGGIKLGTSGLIAAYREATRLALEGADIVEKAEEVTLTITFGYLSMNSVMKLVKSLSLQILEQCFDNTCKIVIAVRRDQSESLARRFADIEGVNAEVGDDIL
ncbi:MAG: YigZ family protein [Muribaculaceae bacterium]|nr:YigZ family protein [Muribaculaceae bacterium]